MVTTKGYEVRRSAIEGRGIYATRSFRKGEDVLTFEGDMILQEPGMHTLQIDYDKHLLVNEPERYVNHSCDPNCGIKEKATLVALRHIKEGDEITFDYAMTEYRLGGFERNEKCLCGSEICRGNITGHDELPDKFKEKYKGYISSYLQKSDIK